MAISMLKIRRPLGRLIFNMGIAIPGKTVFLIETAPCIHQLILDHIPTAYLEKFQVLRCRVSIFEALQWRHDERDGVSNNQPNDCLFSRLFRRRSKKTSKLRVTDLCEGNSPVWWWWGWWWWWCDGGGVGHWGMSLTLLLGTWCF